MLEKDFFDQYNNFVSLSLLITKCSYELSWIQLLEPLAALDPAAGILRRSNSEAILLPPFCISGSSWWDRQLLR